MVPYSRNEILEILKEFAKQKEPQGVAIKGQ